MTLWIRAGAGPYLPLVHPVEELPPTANQAYWASSQLVGTVDGVFRQEEGFWRHYLSGQEIVASGFTPDGSWWATGPGLVALGPDKIFRAEDDFSSGCLGRDGLFLAGKKGVWLLQDGRLRLVHPVSTPERIRLFVIEDQVCLFLNGPLYVWRESKFIPHPVWPKLPLIDALPGGTTPQGYALLAPEGLFILSHGSLTSFAPEGLKEYCIKGCVGGYVGEHYAVVAAFYAGVRAVASDGRILWELSPKELGGNPYSIVKTSEGFLVGTSGGSVRLFTEALSLHALPGELISSVDHRVHFASGAFELATGMITPGTPSLESDGASATWSKLTLPGGRTLSLPGREIMALCAYKNGWVTLQPAVLTHLDAAGNILQRTSVNSANSMRRDGDNVWIGTGTGLYRFDGHTLEPVVSGHTVSVFRGEPGPVFAWDDTLRLPDGHEFHLPGKIIAVDREFAAIRNNDSLYVGRWSEGHWHPQDVPGLPADLSHLRHEDSLLYVISPHEILRVDLARTAGLNLPLPSHREVTVEKPDFIATLPVSRPAPWPNPHYQVVAGGEPVPVVNGAYTIPRLPYGDTEVRVTTTLGGLVSHENILLHRLRPWWYDWPGGVLYLLALSGGVMGLVRWRTHRLTLRARELQLKVEERTSELKEALKARELFFSSVSHEIRNPLNGVAGLCDMLNEASVGARERLLVKTLKSCSDQLRRILDDVLDFGRIDRGELEFHLEVFDLGPAIEGAARAVDPTLARVQLAAPAGVWVEGDVGKLRQVVTNLVSNALKYGQPPLARVEVDPQPEPDGYVALEVRVINSGPDLPAAEQESIFAGFHRGEDARRRRLPGSGLGLSLSRRLMRAMRGDLTVTSTGGLTTFRLSMRLRPAAPADETAAPQAPLRLSKALAIEDEHYNRLVLGHILGQLGYEVDWAVDGASALETLKTGTYDLILTDYMLPDMDGVALARRLLASAAAPAPPIVMVTAYSTREKQDAAHAAGISGFVTKPVTVKKLQAALLGLGYGLRGRRSLDVIRPSGRFDFAVFHRMNDGRAALGQFADQFEESFQSLLGLVDKPEALRKAAHALRGRATVIHATSLAEQLGVLEALAVSGDRDGVARVLSVLEPMVHDLAETARHHVFSSSDFGKTLG